MKQLWNGVRVSPLLGITLGMFENLKGERRGTRWPTLLFLVLPSMAACCCHLLKIKKQDDISDAGFNPLAA